MPTQPKDKPTEKPTTGHEKPVRFMMSVTKDTYHLIMKVKKIAGAQSEQEIVRNALNYYFVAHGYKIIPT
jgi:hypothetical protein